MAYASTWRGDYGGGAALQLGARWSHTIGVDALVWESLATVNERMNTGLTLGLNATIPRDGIRPYARLFAIHQHEEGLVSVAYQPFGAVFGVGAGIRHRYGGGLSAGIETPIGPQDDRTHWSLRTLATGVYMPGPLGPEGYFMLSAILSVDWETR